MYIAVPCFLLHIGLSIPVTFAKRQLNKKNNSIVGSKKGHQLWRPSYFLDFGFNISFKYV